jgi:hypothetical protein
MDVATTLRIPRQRLIRDRLDTSTITFAHFATYSYDGRINAQIVDEPAGGFFGPMFPITPSFTDQRVLTVFGREDFFNPFILCFDDAAGLLEIDLRPTAPGESGLGDEDAYETGEGGGEYSQESG